MNSYEACFGVKTMFVISESVRDGRTWVTRSEKKGAVHRLILEGPVAVVDAELEKRFRHWMVIQEEANKLQTWKAYLLQKPDLT